MKRGRKCCLLAVGSVAAFCQGGGAQAPPAILKIDTENFVTYVFNEPSRAKFATNPERTNPGPVTNFNTFIYIADIVAVDGTPARGMHLTGLFS